MRIQTILNPVEKFKLFVYNEAGLLKCKDGSALVVRMTARKNRRVFRSGCGRPAPAYDRLEERRFDFVPIRGILVFPTYRIRRVNRNRCGTTSELVPWCDGKNPLTTTYCLRALYEGSPQIPLVFCANARTNKKWRVSLIVALAMIHKIHEIPNLRPNRQTTKTPAWLRLT